MAVEFLEQDWVENQKHARELTQTDSQRMLVGERDGRSIAPLSQDDLESTNNDDISVSSDDIV